MTYDELMKANQTIATIDLKNKQYAEVNQRIKAFRQLFPNGSIQTDIVSMENGVVVFKATILDESGKVLGTGTAYEKEGSTFINKTSYIENCETSAVGRALGMCGIGIDTSVASYEEVANAMAQQNEKPVEVKPEVKETIEPIMATALRNRLAKANVNEEKMCQRYGVYKCESLTIKDHNHICALLDKQGL